MFSEEQKKFMKTLGLNFDFDNLSKDDDAWFEIEEKVADKLEYEGLDINYNPTSIGLMCEAILDKLPN